MTHDHDSPDGVAAGQPKTVNSRYAAIVIGTNLLLIMLALVFADHDMGAILCGGIALICASLLIVRLLFERGKRRLLICFALAAWLVVSTALVEHYSLSRDHLRWFFLSGAYKAKLMAQPVPAKQELRHIEWDGWGFAGMETTVFLVFDPTDSLSGVCGASPPIKARGVPCEVFRVRRLEKQWYAVMFYTETYWGASPCS